MEREGEGRGENASLVRRQLRHISPKLWDTDPRPYNAKVAAIDPKNASAILKVLNKEAPLQQCGLGHLKRIRRVQDTETDDQGKLLIIIDSSQTFHNNADRRSHIMKELNAFNISEECLRDAPVPSREPITPEQATACQQLWPIKVHPPPHSHRVDAIPDNVLSHMPRFMAIAIDQAEDSMLRGGCGVGAVIVDPQSDTIVAAAGDASPPEMSPYSLSPHNSSSVASNTSNNTSNDDENNNETHCETQNNSKSSLQDEGHPLMHAVMACIAGVAQREQRIKEGKVVDGTTCASSHGTLPHNQGRKRRRILDSENEHDNNTEDNAEHPQVKRQRKVTEKSDYHNNNNNNNNNSIKNDNNSTYLCTGYDIYTTHEPCAMCSMALVHSRIRTVIFGLETPVFGGVASQFHIHEEPSLNHRYVVYGGLMEDEIRQRLKLEKHKE